MGGGKGGELECFTGIRLTPHRGLGEFQLRRGVSRVEDLEDGGDVI